MTTTPLSILVVASDNHINHILEVIEEKLPDEIDTVHLELCENVATARDRIKTGDGDVVLVSVVDVESVNSLRDSLFDGDFSRFIPLFETYSTDLIYAIDKDFDDYFCMDQIDRMSLGRLSRLVMHNTQDLSAAIELTVAHNVDATILLDQQGKVLLYNPAAMSLFGQTEDDLRQTQIGVPVIHGESVELDIVKGDSEIVIAELRSQLVEWRGESVYLATLRDISDRKALENRLREAEMLSSGILNSLQMNIAVVNEHGEIIKVNDAWQKFAQENGDPEMKHTGVGINYFDTLKRTYNGKTPPSLRGMLDVLNGKLAYFEHKYPCHSPTEKRWFLMRVTSLDNEFQRGLVVAHINITIQQTLFEEQEGKNTTRSNKRSQSRITENYNHQLQSFEDFTRNNSADDSIEDPMQQLFYEYSDAYKKLLDRSLERRAYKVEHNISGMARDIAIELGRQTIRPRELVRLHLFIIKKHVANLSVVKRQAYENEGRIILLEIMGYLATFYRDNLINSLKLQSL